ncbi:olfactory receptor 5M1-like [Puma concolor]|uniref:Olfactory receptor 5M1-like n=1 Tax=Puma concolor TaxID=9696 RepID=A0A6P6IA81_PUMCO|nr:olfactory receptor 5M1-like [Puma concolor]
MSSPNHTTVTEFILLGLTDDPVLEKILFGVFLVIYLITLAGNLCMIMLIRTNSHLQTPMYFFLSHLSFVDIGYSSNITPNMLHNFLSDQKTISYAGCFTQCLLFIALVITEFYILASMAGLTLSSSLFIIVLSYLFIIAAILRIRSAEGRHKAFSTCGSHLTTVTLFYGTLFCMYLRTPSEKSVEESKIIAVFYTFLSPMLNPLIYSLRNKDVVHAMQQIIQGNLFHKIEIWLSVHLK